MADHGPQNAIVLPQMGMNPWVPYREIVGMAITHSGCFGVSHAPTVRDGDAVQYSPTVLYANLPCGESFLSLQELRCRNYELPAARRILADDIGSGRDPIGSLIMRPQVSILVDVLTISEARRSIPHVNATAMQVAAGVLAGTLWAIRNSRKGLCFPEDLSREEVLGKAEPYLGQVVSVAVNCTPLSGYWTFFLENPAAKPIWDNPWQFSNLVFRP
jgi:homospermidine synthase